MATVRYIVNDVKAAIAFYTGLLGFELKQNFGPAMAILAKDDLVLWVAGPVASAQRPMSEGSHLWPGWAADPRGRSVRQCYRGLPAGLVVSGFSLALYLFLFFLLRSLYLAVRKTACRENSATL